MSSKLTLAVGLVALIGAIPAAAQSPDFDPYQAVLDHMPEAELARLATATYGDIVERWSLSTSLKRVPEGESPVTIWSLVDGDASTGFYLCNGRALGFVGKISPELAGHIGRKESIVGYVAETPIQVIYGDGYVSTELAGLDVMLTFIGTGTKSSAIELVYPLSVTRGAAHTACAAMEP